MLLAEIVAFLFILFIRRNRYEVSSGVTDVFLGQKLAELQIFHGLPDKWVTRRMTAR